MTTAPPAPLLSRTQVPRRIPPPPRSGRLAGVAAVCVAGLLLGAGPAAAAPPNDNRANAEPVAIGDAPAAFNVGATVESSEPFTVNDPDGFRCLGPNTRSGSGMNSTLWYELVGDGSVVTAFTLGSTVDTVLGAYRGDQLFDCDDDRSEEDLWSEVRFQTVRGGLYRLQLGSACDDFACTVPGAEGATQLFVFGPPGNDDRVAAARLALAHDESAFNFGATEERGETLNCDGSPYGKTLWYRVTAPEGGTLKVSASGVGQDSVIALYRASDGALVACNDDPEDSAVGARASAAVGPGEYLVQAGGFGDGVGAADGSFVVRADFDPTPPNPDRDADGSVNDADCAPDNASIHPGAPEIPNNESDENCDGRKGYDRDGDGSWAKPVGNDCDDGSARRHPDAREIPGNRVDEDCDGVTAPYPRVGATFSLKYKYFKAAIGRRSRLEFVQFVVRGIDAGSVVTLRCSGSRACPARRMVKKVKRRTGKLDFLVRFRRQLPVRTRIQISVTHRGQIGVVRMLKVREARVDDRSLCQRPGARKPHRCSRSVFVASVKGLRR